MASGAVSFAALSPRIPMPFAPLALFSSSSSSFSSTSAPLRKIRVARAAAAAAAPMAPLGPRDSFLSKLAAAGPPHDSLGFRSSLDPDADTLPCLEFFGGGKSMSMSPLAAKTHKRRRRARSIYPDLPTKIFSKRIIYIGMPLVSIVSELVIAQLLYLQWRDPKKPIYIYVNSTGTTQANGEPVASETEGFAIYDAMMLVPNEIYTVAIGAAIGQACLIVAAGTKGRRYMMPHAIPAIQEPRIAPTDLLRASDLHQRTSQVQRNRDTFVKLLSEHTGHSVEAMSKVLMRSPFYMNALEAKEFGIVDKVLWRGQVDVKEFMSERR